jgi:hypothetical protein
MQGRQCLTSASSLTAACERFCLSRTDTAYAGACYHVTCRGNARQAIFRDEQDRQAFLTRLGVSF